MDEVYVVEVLEDDWDDFDIDRVFKDEAAVVKYIEEEQAKRRVVFRYGKYEMN